MRLLLPLFLLATFSTARNIPEFDDEFLGRMVVSKKKFPFLTPKHAPEIAHVYPTDQQLEAIKKAMGGPNQFALRIKRSLNEDDGFPIDSDVAFGWFKKFQKFLGQFLKNDFGYKLLTSTGNNRNSLPFDIIKSNAFFRALLSVSISKNYCACLGLILGLSLFPCSKMLIYGGITTFRDFDKETIGSMVYYKVACILVKDSYFVGLSTYDNVFALHPVERVEAIEKSEWNFLFASRNETETETWFERRSISPSDLKHMLDYIMHNFAERIRVQYRLYLNAADIPV